MSGEVQEQIEREQRMTAEIKQIRSEVLDLARMIESLSWRTDDPREHVNKRQRIVVVTGDDRPALLPTELPGRWQGRRDLNP